MQLRSLTRMCERVPSRWKSMAVNWMTMMAKKKNTRTIPIGSKWRYSLVMITWKNNLNSIKLGLVLCFNVHSLCAN